MSECPGGDIIVISSGFWRENNETDRIFECYNFPPNCIGGKESLICQIGLIGPLCESCDIYGELGV